MSTIIIGKERSNGMSRRDMMRRAGLGLGMATLGSIVPLGKGRELRADPLPAHKRLAIINLRGGNDGLNTVVPVGLSNYYSRRSTIALPSNTCLSLAGGPGSAAYKLHPSLVNLQSLWNEGSVAVIHNVGYPSANLSHFVSEDIWSYGLRNASEATDAGWVARYADLNTASSMGVVSVGMGTRKDFVGGTSNPFIVGELTNFQFNTDWRYTRNHALRLQKVQEMLGIGASTGLGAEVAISIDQAYELESQIAAARTSYASTVSYENQSLARRMRDIATLIQGGFETEIFYTGFGGFDTHSGQAAAHATLMTRLDNAIGSFAADMKDMGIWNDVCVTVISEFGRRNFENGSDGTDHGEASCLIVVGGAVNGGIYGQDIANGDLLGDNLEYSTDFRTVYKQILDDFLGVDGSAVFTEAQDINTSPGAFI